jgi:hypothetical protein
MLDKSAHDDYFSFSRFGARVKINSGARDISLIPEKGKLHTSLL